MKVLAAALLATTLANPVSDQARPPVRPTDLLDLWNLAKPHPWRVYQVSSYDRTGGNDDGFSDRYDGEIAARQKRVLLDVEGPGCIFRIWSANPQEQTRLEFFFDGQRARRFSCAFTDLFRDRLWPFKPPLSEIACGGAISYIPIPFDHSLRIVAHGPLFFYQITHARFADGTDIESFHPEQEDGPGLRQVLGAFTFRKPREVVGAEPLDVRKSWIGSDSQPISTFAPIQFPLGLFFDQALQVDVAGPAAITELVINARGDDPAYVRRTLVSIFLDGAEEPAVETPLGDLFGVGYPGATINSLPLSVTNGVFVCRFVMPFAKSLRLLIRNGDRDNRVQVDAVLSGVKGDVSEFGGLRFHARFQREVTAKSKYFDLLDARGSGHYVGCVMTMSGPRGITYLEGDEQALVDGGDASEYHGTGTEDYFNAGWYYRTGEYSRPLHGLTHKSELNGQISTYRFHVTDAIPYTSSIKFRIEHGGGNDEPGVEYSGVTYWYAHAGDSHQFERLDHTLLEPPRRVVGYDRDAIHVRSMETEEDADLVYLERLSREECGPVYARLTAQHPAATLRFEVGIPDRYEVFLLHANTRMASQITVSVGDMEPQVLRIGSLLFEPVRETRLGVQRLTAGFHELKLEIEGSSGRAFVGGIRLEPALPFVRKYQLYGTFHLGAGRAFDQDHGPESKVVSGWVDVEANENGYLDLRRHAIPAEQSVIYARFFAHSPTARDVTLRVGSDDWVAVFVNRKEVHRHIIHRGAMPDQDIIPVSLKEGKNEILLKVANEDGGFGLYARISDPIGGITLDPE